MVKQVIIPEWAARLAVSFLADLSERMGNAGCNDYTVPEGIPMSELHKALVGSNGGSEADADGMDGYDYAVVGAVQWMIAKSLGAPQ